MENEDRERPFGGPEPEQILRAIEQQRGEGEQQIAEQERVQYLGFYLGQEVYGLPLRQLREVERVTRIRSVPGAPASVAGLVNLRGEIICALNPKAILSCSETTLAETPFLVVLRGSEEPLGLVVDSIADIYEFSPDQIESPLATWPSERAQFFVGTVRVQDALMGVLDLERVIAP